jgi:outer membrane protein
VLSGEDQLELAKTQASVSQKQLERAEVLDKEGAIPPQQLYDLKGQVATDQLSIINAQNSIAIAKLTLLQMLNVPYKKDVRLQRQASDTVTPRYGDSADQVYGVALSNFASVKAGTLKRQSAEKAVQVAKGALLPSLALYGGLNTNYSSAAQRSILVNQTVVPTNQFIETPSGRQTVYATQSNYVGQNIAYVDQFRNNYRTNISLGLSIPILNYFQNRNKITLAKINLQTARDVEQTNQLQLKVNIDKAYDNMAAAYERYQLILKQTEAFTQSFYIAEARFNAGASTSVDFLIVKGNLDRAKTNLINARYDYLIRTRILDYYQGKLAL